MWSIERRLALATVVTFLNAGPAGAVTEPPPEPIRLGLYEWMGTAPVVVAANVIEDDAKFTRAVVSTSIKGDLAAGAVVEIDERQANRDRDEGTPALDLTKGKTYLFLLQRSTRGPKEPYPVFDLTRGVQGAKALPAEGSAATIDAVTRLAEVQQRKNDDYVWTVLPDFLEDTNPILVDTALDLYVKFRRDSLAIAPRLEPLLETPRPDVRRRAAILMGRVLLRQGAEALPERPAYVAGLTGRARRDDDTAVRRAATAALAALPDVGVDETLHAIARDDADQDVRFEAVKALAERLQGAKAKRSD
jgi:hypothetical protein